MIRKYAISVAPMMNRTDPHFRFFIRLMSKEVLLYTEMVAANALLYGTRTGFLRYNPEEPPVVFQVGGSDPKALAQCAQIIEQAGYTEINLNVGCPSEKVQSGRFGVCLMRDPELVAECVHSMRERCSVPVTVKHRIGVDDEDSYEFLARFVDIVRRAKPGRFIVHARKAILDSFSPKENRNIPPLRYDLVYRLKEDFPKEIIEINGGILTLEQVRWHLQFVDGVMIGRAAYRTPKIFLDIDRELFDKEGPDTGWGRIVEILGRYGEYASREKKRGVSPTALARPIHHFFDGEAGARFWRRGLNRFLRDDPGEVIRELLEKFMENTGERNG